MIIFMKSGDMELAKKTASELSAFGDVQIKPANGDGQIVLAVLSSLAERLDPAGIEEMDGVERCEKDNDFFTENYWSFHEAWQFFLWAH